MAVTTGTIRSTLNPNAPPFIPAAIQMVEDFSPEWWHLIKTSTWFREHWLHTQEEQELLGANAEDNVTNLLPDTFDVGFEDDMTNLDEFDEAFLEQAFVLANYSAAYSLKSKSKADIGATLKNGNVKSAKNYQPTKHWEKPVQVVNPKKNPHRIIQQPR